MTNHTKPVQLPPVLAKDRHFLTQTAIKLSKLAKLKKPTPNQDKNQHPSQSQAENLSQADNQKQAQNQANNQSADNQSIDTLDKTQDVQQQKLNNEFSKLQQKYERILAESTQAVAERIDSVPVITLNEDLPVSQKAEELVKAIQDNQVIIVAGETGSGKTTQLPKIAMMAGRGVTGQIGHTQPRRLAARSVSNRIAEELGEKLGDTVSFKIRFNEQGSAKSIIKLMTDGILLAELGHDRFLSKYDTIIIDEAHERSLNIDFIMGYLKNLLPKRSDLKVIITSATLDTQRFSQYFSRYDRKTKQTIIAPVFNVEGRSFPVEVRYRPLTDEPVASSDDDSFDEFEDNLPRAVIAAVEECFDDAQAKGHPNQADILIFAATEAEIRDLQEVLECEITRNTSLRHTQVLPLFARQTFAEQQRIFQPNGAGRRIIISTNVAETALTVPNIRYVIDLGFARISRYSYRSRVQRLPIEAISQAAANQRKGRCGRIAAGMCIRLYSEEDFTSRPEFTEPEILRTNLASVMLQMASLRLGAVEQFDFIQAPDTRLVKDGSKLLEELGAIKTSKTTNKTSNSKTSQSRHKANKQAHKQKGKRFKAYQGVELTAVGKKMARMPIDPRLARMLIAGSQFDCLQDMLIIVSALAVQDPRERPHEKRTQADQKHALFRQENSDFLFYIKLWQALFGTNEDGEKLTNNQRKSFAKKHYLSFPRIREWQKTHQQLLQMVKELKLSGVDDIRVGTSDAGKNSPLKQGEFPADAKDKKKLKRLSLNSNKPLKLSPEQEQARQALLAAEQQRLVKYANLHRALLTGLLSFIAHKAMDSNVRGEYLATRQQKTKIFPASTVFKETPAWVMAFEVVETSQVFMRCVAKIEPEWIISAAGGLLKYHYFEPHWSKKTGRVRAYAQISLFGLIVVSKELCNYEQINLSESREIFIRDGLVTGQYGYDSRYDAQFNDSNDINKPNGKNSRNGKNDNAKNKNAKNKNSKASKNASKTHIKNLANASISKKGTPKFAGRIPPFLQHNLDKIADVELIEEKLRRRDLLVDEEALYQLYDSKIPEHVASRKAFEDWRAEVEASDSQYLFFSDDDVLKQTAPTTGDFPENWRLGSLKLPLSYVFDPASDDDGVSIRVPMPALPQLNPIELLWGIAGWRFELVTQLLKTLPKDIRRQIVPIPDTATAIFTELEKNHQQGLLKQLCQALTRRGVRGATSEVTPNDFDPSKVDRYLQPQICVVDDKNRLIEKGRDLTTLQIRHATETSQAVHEHKGRHDSFPEHFKFSKNRHSAGIVMKEFAALVSDNLTADNLASGQSNSKKSKSAQATNPASSPAKTGSSKVVALGTAVSIHQFTDITAALAAHRVGVLTLVKNKLGAKQKQLTSQIDKVFKLAFAPLGQLDKLKTIIIDATLDATLCQNYVSFEHSQHLPERLDGAEAQINKKLAEQLPFNIEEYEQTETAILANFLSVGQAVLQLLKQVYTRWQRVRQALLMLDTEIFGESIDDIEDQLDDLHLADFVYRMDYAHWTQYPRYLEGLEIRIDRLAHNLDNDLDGVYELDVHMERLSGRADDPKIAEYRWLVEEFRIQLFAQPMKTKGSVSQKKLEKVWGGVG